MSQKLKKLHSYQASFDGKNWFELAYTCINSKRELEFRQISTDFGSFKFKRVIKYE
jgi:hypothetical protein